jgi:hypothetical protein
MTGPMYAFSTVAVVRSYSPHFGAMSIEQETNTSGAMRRTSSRTRCSWPG